MSVWMFGNEAACRFIARTAWPWEAEESRDSWALKIEADPDFGRSQLELARLRLDLAAEALGLTKGNPT